MQNFTNDTDTKIPQPTRNARSPSRDTSDLVGLYLRELRRFKVLTVQEEQEIATCIQQDWIPYKEIPDDQLSPEQLRAKKRGFRAREKLIKHNLRLAVHIAKKFRNTNVPFLDRIQMGSMGLERAAEKFDPTRGYKFSTYAYWWVRQALTREMPESDRLIHIPAYLLERQNKIKKFNRKFRIQHDRYPSQDEIAAGLELTVDQVAVVLDACRHAYSLDMPLSNHSHKAEGDTTTLGELIPIETDSPEEMFDRSLMAEDVKKILAGLPPREAEIIKLRYGIGTGKPMTLEAIGELYNLSRERIRQIEQKAKRKAKSRAVRLRNSNQLSFNSEGDDQMGLRRSSEQLRVDLEKALNASVKDALKTGTIFTPSGFLKANGFSLSAYKSNPDFKEKVEQAISDIKLQLSQRQPEPSLEQRNRELRAQQQETPPEPPQNDEASHLRELVQDLEQRNRELRAQLQQAQERSVIPPQLHPETHLAWLQAQATYWQHKANEYETDWKAARKNAEDFKRLADISASEPLPITNGHRPH